MNREDLHRQIELRARVGVEIPETDYPALTSLDAIADYVAARRG